jgi:putative peptide zinc metalloprotease protein
MPEAGKKQSEYLKLCQDVEYVEGELRKADSDNIAPFNGIVTKLDKRMQPGFMPGEGAVVGEFQSSDDCVIHALVPGRDIHKVNLGGSVDVWLPLGTGLTLSRKVDRVRNWSETDLKDSPFSSRFGGELATEATGDQDKDVPLDDYFICSSYFVNSARIPLGLTGRYVIPTPPRSRISRYIDGLYSLFHRESVL